MPLPYQIPNPLVIASDALSAPPSNSVPEGTAYLVVATASSTWTGFENSIALWRQGTWAFIAPVAGMIVYSEANGNLKSYSGSAWAAVGGGSGTVTSVAIAGNDGIDIDSGSPITTAGTITLGLSSIPNASLANSSVTVAGTAVALGESGTIAVAGLSDAPAAPSADNLLSYATGSSAYVATTGMTYVAGTSTLSVKNITVGASSVLDNGANRLTNIAKGTASGDALQKGQIASTSASEGASLVGLQDSAGNYAATEVEAALAEIVTLSLIRRFTHTAYRSGSFTDGQRIRLFLNTTDNDANFVIPAGQTLKVLAAYGRCKAGAGVGTTWTLGITSWQDQAHAGANNHDLATGTTEDTNVFINISATGTLASPLASIVGDDDPVAMCFIEHDNDASRASASDKHTIMVYGVFVDD